MKAQTSLLPEFTRGEIVRDTRTKLLFSIEAERMLPTKPPARSGWFYCREREYQRTPVGREWKDGNLQLIHYTRLERV